MADVKEFKFPKDFGFTGSAGQVHVRAHVRQKFAKGGRVGRVKRPALKPSPGQVVGGALAAGAGAAIYGKLKGDRGEREDRSHRREQLDRAERAAGLKHGGKVSHDYRGMKNGKRC